MKKHLVLIIFIFFATASCVFSQGSQQVAIFPVDVQTRGSSYNIYPNTLNLISADIYNVFSRKKISIESPIETDKKINQLFLNTKYYNFMKDFKNYQSINFQECKSLAQRIGASKIIMVTGGFDSQSNLLKPKLFDSWDIFSGKDFASYYKLNISIILVDPYGEKIIAEKNFSKDIPADNFACPSQSFAENVVPLREIKKFSTKIASAVSIDFNEYLTSIAINPILTKDGAMTKDGHFSSVKDSFDKVINKKKENFKNWVQESL